MTTETIEVPVNTKVRDESFYLERFKRCVNDRNYMNGRMVDEHFKCEIYKGFAIVIWQVEWQTPVNNKTRTTFNNYVWEVGGVFDNLDNLGWISQGCITTGYNSESYEKTVKKSRKKVDLLAEIYSHKSELIGLSHQYQSRAKSEPIYNALIGDVVAIHAFNRTRLGKIVKLVGNRFVVAYMTPSNQNDVHYKTLPLSQIYPKD